MKLTILVTFSAYVAPSSLPERTWPGIPGPQDAVHDVIESDGPRQKKRLAHADITSIVPAAEPDESGFDEGGLDGDRPLRDVPSAEQDESGFLDDMMDFDMSGDTRPSTQENPRRSPGGYGTGASDASVFVTMGAEDNGFLTWPPRSTAPFADPVTNPTETKTLELEPLEETPTDITRGRGVEKTGKFYRFKGQDDVFIIKWFHARILPHEKNDWTMQSWNDRDFIYEDFLGQSIAHLLSKIYSERVEDDKKVYYVQPLLVKSEQADGVHFGLMEREFIEFHRYSAPNIWHSRVFNDFIGFLDSRGEFLSIGDPQGWYRDEPNSPLFMTDAAVGLQTPLKSWHPLSAQYNFHEIYDILNTKFKMMNFDTARIIGQERCIFGVSREDDTRTIRAILAARKTKCITLGPI